MGVVGSQSLLGVCICESYLKIVFKRQTGMWVYYALLNFASHMHRRTHTHSHFSNFRHTLNDGPNLLLLYICVCVSWGEMCMFVFISIRVSVAEIWLY